MKCGDDYVSDAADFARKLAMSEMRFPGDHGLAMRRLSRQIKVQWSVLKNLHYRSPKYINISDFEKLGVEVAKRKIWRRVDEPPRTAMGRILVRVGDQIDQLADTLDRQADEMGRWLSLKEGD